MFRRFLEAIKYAAKEGTFAAVFGTAISVARWPSGVTAAE
jgi:hypothetical protein